MRLLLSNKGRVKGMQLLNPKMKLALDKTWLVGWDRHYLRLYPNPGFLFTMFGRSMKWSKFYGWNDRRGFFHPRRASSKGVQRTAE